MFNIRKGTDRGITNIGWLDGRHTFSFGDFVDPKHHQYRSWRRIRHPHRDMTG